MMSGYAIDIDIMEKCHSIVNNFFLEKMVEAGPPPFCILVLVHPEDYAPTMNRKIKDRSDESKYYFHVYNRGVEKRNIFCDQSDYYRFIHDLYEFNDSEAADPHLGRIGGGRASTNLKDFDVEYRQRDTIVDIVCFCLMPNHFHLMVGAKDKKTLTKFMQKLGTGYAMYFNEKYKRVGCLFQGRYKSILIEQDAYLTHLSKYIHLNPIKKRSLGVTSLDTYKYSSYLDFSGKINIPFVTSRKFLEDYFDGPEDYEKFVKNNSDSQPLDALELID
jgi:putative transposase